MTQNKLWTPLQRNRLSRRKLLSSSAKVGVGAAGLALVGCGDDDDDSASQAEAPAVSDTFSWKMCPSFEAPFAGLYAWVYLAEELGYFKEEGITNDWVYKTGCAPLVVSGAADVAFLDVPETLNAYNAGQDVKAVWQPGYGLIFAVFVPDDSPIQSFNADDLRGQTIGITEFAGGEVPVVRALMGRIGLVEGQDYQLLPTSGLPGQQPTVDAFESGQIVAFGGGYHDAFGVELAGKPLREITPDFLKDNRASECFAIRGEVLEDDEGRDQAVRYLRACAKGMTFLHENIEAAARIGHMVTGEPEEDVENSIDLLTIFWLNRTKRNPGVAFGEVDSQGWADFEQILLDGATGEETDPLAFDEFIDVDVVIDNSLIDGINDFDADAVRQQARDWTA